MSILSKQQLNIVLRSRIAEVGAYNAIDKMSSNPPPEVVAAQKIVDEWEEKCNSVYEEKLRTIRKLKNKVRDAALVDDMQAVVTALAEFDKFVEQQGEVPDELRR